MGKITLTVEGTTVGTVAEGKGIQVSYEVSETDSARLIAAYADIENRRLAFIPENLRKTLTTEDVVKAWFNRVIEQSAAEVKAHEQQKAAEAAQKAVAPIVVEKKED